MSAPGAGLYFHWNDYLLRLPDQKSLVDCLIVPYISGNNVTILTMDHNKGWIIILIISFLQNDGDCPSFLTTCLSQG